MVFSAAVYASQSNPSKYTDVVAKIGNTELTGNQLSGQVEIEKNKWERIGNPQTEIFYVKAALRQLVLNELLEVAAKKKGIVITDEEASKYLNNIVNNIEKLDDNAPASIQLYNDIKACGYNSIEDYVNSPLVIESTKNVLMRAQVKDQVLSTVSMPSDEEVDNYIKLNKLNISSPEQRTAIKHLIHQNNISQKWNKYINDLIASDNYELFLDVDIKGFMYPEVELNKSVFYKGSIKQ